MAISLVFFEALFVSNPFAMYEDPIIENEKEIKFEQLNEVSTKIDEASKNIANEEFGNQTNQNKISF